MNVIEKAVVERLAFPIDEYIYNVRITRSIDGGKTFWYCGCGKFFKTHSEAEAYATEINVQAKDFEETERVTALCR